MNNCTFGQSDITNILSISRNDWSLTPIENQLHSMTINCVLETFNNTICIETYIQLQLHTIVYSKWSIINVNWQMYPYGNGTFVNCTICTKLKEKTNCGLFDCYTVCITNRELSLPCTERSLDRRVLCSYQSRQLRNLSGSGNETNLGLDDCNE